MMQEEYSNCHSSSNSGVKYGSLLHSVRKSIAKPCKKAPVAPMPPTPIKVYKVDPMNFRDLVQHLTGAPEFNPHHHQLQSLPPMVVSSFVDARSRDIEAAGSSDFSWAPKLPVSEMYLQDLQAEAMGMAVKSQGITEQADSLELNLSSPSYNWYSSFPPMSPGSMTSLEQGRVL